MEKTVKELKKIAKEVGIVGYSNMRKDDLIASIETAKKVKETNEAKSDNEYINRLATNQIVAFKVGNYVISGKTIEVGKTVLIETKNGRKFRIAKDGIIWVKTGTRWPRFVYDLLKGKNNADERNKEISD